MTEAGSRRVAFLVANEGVEQVELKRPWQAMAEAGFVPELVAPTTGEVQAFNHLDKADTFPVDAAVDEADPRDYRAVVLPGGVANPDQLRTVPRAVEFIKDCFEASKPVAVICHGPWTLVEGDLVKGRTLTSWPSLRTDIENAGGHWVDREVQVCEHGPNVLISSRRPDDLPAFCRELASVVQPA